MTAAPRFSNGRNPSGSMISFPTRPRKTVGRPARVAPEKEGVNRSYRLNYDWKVYSPRQLTLMEAWWDRFVELFAGLLPERLRTDATQHLGINLGTFNGCFQKAWMRRGYRMYGIEIADVIDELHEYGCAGHRASFFNLAGIDSDAYDFAVLDRCICGDAFYDSFDRPLDAQRSIVTDDALGNRIELPPFFAEMFRILKPGGALLAVLYNHWSGRILRELSTYGALTLWPVEGWHPLLAVLVETDRPPDRLPDLAVHLDTLEAELGGDARSPASWRRALEDSPLVYGLQDSPHGTLRFLYLPDNHLVDLRPGSDGTRKVLEDAFWIDAPWKESFFEPRLTILPPERPDPRPARPVILLADDPRFNPKRNRGYEVALRPLLGEGLRLLHIPQRVRSSRHALGNLGAVARRAAGGVVVVSLGRGDTAISPRNDRPLIPREEHVANMRRLVEGLQRCGITVLFLEAVPLRGARGDDEARRVRQNELIAAYNRADLELMAELGCPVVTARRVSGPPLLKSRLARWISRAEEQRIARAIGNEIRNCAPLSECSP